MLEVISVSKEIHPREHVLILRLVLSDDLDRILVRYPTTVELLL